MAGSKGDADAVATQHDNVQTGDPHGITAVEATMIADEVVHNKPSPFTLGMLRLYGCLLIGYLCATMNGFDGAVMGSVLVVKESSSSCLLY
jgi:hypothetical protein